MFHSGTFFLAKCNNFQFSAQSFTNKCIMFCVTVTGSGTQHCIISLIFCIEQFCRKLLTRCSFVWYHIPSKVQVSVHLLILDNSFSCFLCGYTGINCSKWVVFMGFLYLVIRQLQPVSLKIFLICYELLLCFVFLQFQEFFFIMLIMQCDLLLNLGACW